MFNNIIYFIIVLLIFNISYQKPSSEVSLFYSLVMLFVTWAVFAGLCRISFQHLAHHVRHEKEAEGAPASHYHRLELKFSVLAIFLFALDVYFFHLRYWLQSIPGLRYFSALQGILALSLFMAYLGTIWYSSHTAYAAAFQVTVSRRAFIVSNIKLNVPILFPWVILS
ncbi:MAG: hypothetical protein P8175_03320, partial [Deltaproteobacteria bacterium]